MRSIWKLPVLTIAAIATLALPTVAHAANWTQIVPQQIWHPTATQYDEATMPTYDGPASNWAVAVTRSGPADDGSSNSGSNVPRCELLRSIVVVDEPAVCTIEVTIPADPDYNRVIATYKASGSANTYISVTSPSGGSGFAADSRPDIEDAVVANNYTQGDVTFTMRMTSGLQDGTDTGKDVGEFLSFLKAWVDKYEPIRMEGNANLQQPTGDWQNSADVLFRYFDHESRVEKIEIKNAAGDVVMSSTAVGAYVKGQQERSLAITGTLTPPANDVLVGNFRVQATDYVGHQSSIETFSAKLDGAKPDITNVSFDGTGVASDVPYEAESDTMELTFNVNDEGAGLGPGGVSATVDGAGVTLVRDGTKYTAIVERTTSTRELLISATDAVGNVREKRASFASVKLVPDTTAPVLVSKTTVEPMYGYQDCVDVSMTFEDPDSRVKQLVMDDMYQDPQTTTAEGTFVRGTTYPALTITREVCGSKTLGTNEGHWLRVIATDEFNNSTEEYLNVYFDGTAPEIRSATVGGRPFSADMAPIVTTNAATTLQVMAMDSYDELASLTATMDGQPLTLSPIGGRWQEFLANITLTTGVHTYTVVATDRAGNATTVTGTMKARVLDPSIVPVLTASSYPTEPQKGCVTVSFTYTDPQARTEAVYVIDKTTWMNFGAIANGAWDGEAGDAGLTATDNICPDDRGAGTYEFIVMSYNGVGGNATPLEFSVTFDLDAPAIDAGTVDGETIADLDEFSTEANTTARWTFSDPSSRITSAAAFLNDKPLDTTTTNGENGLSGAAATFKVPAGTHDLDLVVQDAAGNETTKTVRVVGVKPPAVQPPAVDGGATAKPQPTPGAANGTGVATGGGQVGIASVKPKVNKLAKIQVVAVQGKNGALRKTNMLTLRMKASEWSVWRIKIGGTTFVRRALTKSKWRTVRINLGDVTAIGKKLNAAKPGSFVRIPVKMQGKDGMGAKGKTQSFVFVVRA